VTVWCDALHASNHKLALKIPLSAWYWVIDTPCDLANASKAFLLVGGFQHESLFRRVGTVIIGAFFLLDVPYKLSVWD
jgi:hypothetical protein